MSTPTVDRYVRHVERYGPDGVLEVAESDLGPDGFAELTRAVEFATYRRILVDHERGNAGRLEMNAPDGRVTDRPGLRQHRG